EISGSSAFVEFAGCETGTETRYRYALPAAFDPERFRERHDEGFGRAIDRHVRAGLEGSGGRDIEHASTLLLQHAGPELVCEFDQRAIVQVDHADLAFLVLRVECTRDAEARIVHQHIDIEPARADFRCELVAAAGNAEVDGNGRGLDVVLARKPSGDLL